MSCQPTCNFGMVVFSNKQKTNSRTVLKNNFRKTVIKVMTVLLVTFVSSQKNYFCLIIIIYLLTARVVGVPQMISQPVFSIFPSSPLNPYVINLPPYVIKLLTDKYNRHMCLGSLDNTLCSPCHTANTALVDPSMSRAPLLLALPPISAAETK